MPACVGWPNSVGCRRPRPSTMPSGVGSKSRGSGQHARLDLGDAYSYALAATTGEPLLFVGEDFSHTDLVAARP